MPSKRELERRSRSVVFIGEDDERVDVEGSVFGDWYLTGRFSGFRDTGASRVTQQFEDLSLDEALAWARERADRIVVRIGHDAHYVIGGEPDEHHLRWPAGGIAPPVRRRAPHEAWKGRTDADPDATWTATLALGPPAPPDGEWDDRRRPEWDAVVEDAARSLGVAWSGDNIDGWFADIGRAARAAKRAGRHEYGWTTMHSRTYHLALPVRAPTEARAVAAAEALAPVLPDGWTVWVGVRFDGD